MAYQNRYPQADQMSLGEWCFTYGIVPFGYTNGMWLIDIGQGCRHPTPHIDDVAWELCHLRDYVVSSVQGGWLHRMVKR